jgi:hypothetical protein
MLTLEPKVFEQWLIADEPNVPAAAMHDAYHYLKIGSTMLRSQLDCYSDSLPGTNKTFDLVLPICRSCAFTHFFHVLLLLLLL